MMDELPPHTLNDLVIPEHAATKLRAEQAKRLRMQGKTYREIAEHLGVSRQRAHQIVNPPPRVPVLLRYLRIGHAHRKGDKST